MSNLVTSENKNALRVICNRCKSIILRPNDGELFELERTLPDMTLKKDLVDNASGSGNGNAPTLNVTHSTVTRFWLVKDKFSFENIGFSNQVENEKFLTCADCEIGPVGYFDLSTEQSYIAIDRVDHVQD